MEKNHYVPEMHSLRKSFAVPLGINPNKILFDLKRNAYRLSFFIRIKSELKLLILGSQQPLNRR